jgi:hypothetical protein
MRPPENEQRETHNRKLQQLMQKPPELLQYRFLPNFADAVSDGATVVDSLTLAILSISTLAILSISVGQHTLL